MATDKNKPASKKTEQLQTNLKLAALEIDKTSAAGEYMNTNSGVKINDDQNSLKTGNRGSTLLEDFILREKISHFDHERIPERVVHARGTGAHGVFKLYDSFAKHTKAKFLNDTSLETPVFVRFSTVAGSKGSSDLTRDVRGFAVRFYTQEGNFDLVGNNMPVFFIQDAIKFPDLIHAVKPEPNNEIPQAASAHDTFWDFISLMPESAHMIMWVMSDRALPRSLRMMEGFGVHTFRLVNEEGVSCFVKFHWKPLLGIHAVAWDEAQKISGKDSDFHRRDLWESIDSGNFPEWEFGVQIIPEADEFKFDFDLLDPTKLIPEELVPVQRIGKMTLNRNTDNFFAETEQIAFHLGNIVPGIDFSNDPLLQGRLFSYTDTQLLRLGGTNFHEIPINRPLPGVHNNQRDGHKRHVINKGNVSYSPNSLGGNYPMQAKASEGGFTTYPEKIDARKVRDRSSSFVDHYSQATLLFNSVSSYEKDHIINALSFELGKVKTIAIQERMLSILVKIDKSLAAGVAYNLGLAVPKDNNLVMNQSFGADADPAKYQSAIKKAVLESSPSLSMANTIKDTIKTRKIAILAVEGVDQNSLKIVKDLITGAGGNVAIIANKLGAILCDDGTKIMADASFLTTASVLFDAVYIPGGTNSVASIAADADAVYFINEAYRHCKAIAADTAAVKVLEATYFGKKLPANNEDDTVMAGGIIIGNDAEKLANQFIKAVAQHRFWNREVSRKKPA